MQSEVEILLLIPLSDKLKSSPFDKITKAEIIEVTSVLEDKRNCQRKTKKLSYQLVSLSNQWEEQLR